MIIIILIYLLGSIVAYYTTRHGQLKNYGGPRDWEDIKDCLMMALASWIGAIIIGWELLEDTDPPQWL